MTSSNIEAARLAVTRLAEIRRLTAKIEAEAQRLAEQGAWDATGSLGHAVEELTNLASFLNA